MSLETWFLAGKFAVAGLLTLGGIYAIVYGYKLLRSKAGREHDGTVVTVKNVKVTFGTVGALLILTAWLWGWLASKVVPKEMAHNTPESEIRISNAFPSNQDVLVSLSSASGPTYLECRRDRDLVCYPLAPGTKCGPPPPIATGLGRLQVAYVQRDDLTVRDTVANTLASQLRLFLKTRKQIDWMARVMTYPTKEGGRFPSRVVFNSVPPEVAQPMCTWLACEGWTFGPCTMVPKPEDVP